MDDQLFKFYRKPINVQVLGLLLRLVGFARLLRLTTFAYVTGGVTTACCNSL
jgi:hypothetical protein